MNSSISFQEHYDDLHLNPYDSDEDETEAFYSLQAEYKKRVSRVCDPLRADTQQTVHTDETTSDVLAELLKLLDGLDSGVKVAYLDRRFYNSTCLGLLSKDNYAYVIPMVKWGETIQDGLNRDRSREIEHDLAGEVTSPVFIDCVSQQGR